MLNTPQFITWTTDTAGRKLPTSPHNGAMIDPHLSTNWTDYVTALAAGKPGFVFTEEDSFFFLDIDHCLTGDAWSPLALDLLNRFPGAAVEVSQSGTGLHVFGSYQGPAPEHACKNTALGIELYTSRRFVALTFDRWQGDACTDHTTALHALIADYFRPQVTQQPDGDQWCEDEPAVPDDTIISKALASKSPAAILGGRASFADLFNADAAILGRFYPDPSGMRPYDASSADAALAQHLAWWCNGNHAQVWRIMQRSGLVRDKWQREDYTRRTISNAVKGTKGGYEQPQARAAADAAGTGEMYTSGLQILAPTQQVELFDRCAYVVDAHRMFTPAGEMLTPNQFRAKFGGYTFMMDNVNERTTRNAFEAFTESQAVRFPKVSTTCFRPELPPCTVAEEEGRQMVNSYVPIPDQSKPGDVTPFLTHMSKLLPDQQDQNIFISYLAAMVQHVGVKFQWTPLIQGCEGNGKSFFTYCMEYIIGTKYSHRPKASEVGSRFNSWIERKLFIGIEELYVADRRELVDALKPLITDLRIPVEGKGVDQKNADNRANFIMCSNHKDAVLKNENDRRYCVFYTAQQERADIIRAGMTGDYFQDLYEWLRGDGWKHVWYYLKTYQIPDELNPAKLCTRAPQTSSTGEAIEMSIGPVEQEVMEAVSQGRSGFAGGWISSIALGKLLKEIKAERKIPLNRRRKLLQSLGYDYHPALENGQSTIIIPIDEGRPRLYVKKDGPLVLIQDPAEVVRIYQQCQGS